MPEDVFDLVLPILGTDWRWCGQPRTRWKSETPWPLRSGGSWEQSHRHCKAAALEIQN